MSQSSIFVFAKLEVVHVLHSFAFKDGTKPQRSGLDLYFFSVVVHINLQKYAEAPGKSVRESFLISQSYKKSCTCFSSVHPSLTGPGTSFKQGTVLFTCSSVSPISNCSFCLKWLRTAF